MPFYDDHPIRELMTRAGLKRIELAREAGITYGALDKLMMGMTKTVHPEVAATLARRTGVAPKTIHRMVSAWNERPILEKLPPRTQAMLALDPDDVLRFYASFQGWREEFAENPTQFASIVRMPRASLVEYEQGRRKVFPPNLRAALARTFHLEDPYLDALAGLPPSDAFPQEPTARMVTLENPFLRDDPLILERDLPEPIRPGERPEDVAWPDEEV